MHSRQSYVLQREEAAKMEKVRVGNWVSTIFDGWVRVEKVTVAGIYAGGRWYDRSGRINPKDKGPSLYLYSKVTLDFGPRPASRLVKPYKETMRALIDAGFVGDNEGNWKSPNSAVSFSYDMFEYCGEEKPEVLHFEEEWLVEEKPIRYPIRK
jgi:hypothetical protein